MLTTSPLRIALIEPRNYALSAAVIVAVIIATGWTKNTLGTSLLVIGGTIVVRIRYVFIQETRRQRKST